MPSFGDHPDHLFALEATYAGCGHGGIVQSGFGHFHDQRGRDRSLERPPNRQALGKYGLNRPQDAVFIERTDDGGRHHHGRSGNDAYRCNVTFDSGYLRSKRNPFPTTSRLVPISANTAIHIVPMPMTVSTRKTALIPSASAMFWTNTAWVAC